MLYCGMFLVEAQLITANSALVVKWISRQASDLLLGVRVPPGAPFFNDLAAGLGGFRRSNAGSTPVRRPSYCFVLEGRNQTEVLSHGWTAHSAYKVVLDDDQAVFRLR